MSEMPEKLPSHRRQNRIAAMQFLYMFELNRPEDLGESLRRFFETQEHERDQYAFAEELIHGTLDNLEPIDATIRQHAANWNFNRIAKVDLAILRLAICELLYRDDIPPVVTINEAIDLSKEFSAEDSRRFVNGILDRIRSTLDRPARSPKT